VVTRLERRTTELGTAAGGASGAAGVVGGVACISTGSKAVGRTSADGKLATVGSGSLGDNTGRSLGDNTSGSLGMDITGSINGATGSGTEGEATSIARATNSR